MDLRAPERPLVLIVDDDAAVRDALTFTLDLAGYEVESFGSGEAVLLRSPAPPALCLVIDERLPGISGLETLRQLRARREFAPAILITSHPKPALRDAAAMSAVPILEKPLLGETLVQAIRAATAAGRP
jgi:FixJ family two-component response regulator